MKEVQSMAIGSMFKIFVLENVVIMGSQRVIDHEENQNQTKSLTYSFLATLNKVKTMHVNSKRMLSDGNRPK